VGEVERFEPDYNYEETEAVPDGRWVRYSDYEKARREGLVRLRARLLSDEMVEAVINQYGELMAPRASYRSDAETEIERVCNALDTLDKESDQGEGAMGESTSGGWIERSDLPKIEAAVEERVREGLRDELKRRVAEQAEKAQQHELAQEWFDQKRASGAVGALSLFEGYLAAFDVPAPSEECLTCGSEVSDQRCPKSKRACGHHCNCSWVHDRCRLTCKFCEVPCRCSCHQADTGGNGLSTTGGQEGEG
jgi:hypothetical protein